MENIHFTDESIIGLVLQGVLMMILPIILLIIWKIKTHESIGPVFVGAVTWFLFAIILKLAPAYFLMKHDNPVANTISGNIWLTMALAGVLAGVFEETGRFIAFKFVLKKYGKRITSLSYGIGHGGFESLYVGFQVITIAFVGIMINNGMSDQITAGADEATIQLALGSLADKADLTIVDCLIGTFERIPAIVAHISFSVLVFAAVKNKKYAYLFPLSIVLHTLFDFSTVLYSAKIVPALVFELIFAALAAGLAFFASRIYKKLHSEAERRVTDF